MKRALPLCSLLLVSVAGCDTSDPLLELAEHVEASPTVLGEGVPEESEDLCEVYCEDYRTECGDSFAYASYDACEVLCPYWETDEGDNLAAKCRLAALADTASTHAQTCAEAGPDSEGCGTAYVTTCERYCDLYQSSCNGHGMGFESAEKCETWCGSETLEGAEGDTIECRIGWLTSPFAPPQCDRAGMDSTACQ